MRIVKPDQLLKVDDSWFLPFNRYVVSDMEFDELLARTPKTNWQWSSFNSYERRYAGQDLSGKKVAIYRHAAFGDQLIVSAVPHYLKSLYPTATIHLYCHASVHPLWMGDPFIEGCALPLPMAFDAIRSYDYHIFYEGMLEGNSEDDQANCYDDMFSVIGLNSVPNDFKRPHVSPRPEDYGLYNRYLDQRPYLLCHVAPANPNRMYPFDKLLLFIQQFLVERKEWVAILVGMDRNAMGRSYQFKEQLAAWGAHEKSRVVDLIDSTRNFRSLIPFVQNASLVVCPDSALMHLSACFPHVPVVSLWGVFHPRDRVKYYPNNFPLFLQKVCPHAPCRDHNFQLPLDKCLDAWPKDTNRADVRYCACLQMIEPSVLLDHVERTMGCWGMRKGQ